MRRAALCLLAASPALLSAADPIAAARAEAAAAAREQARVEGLIAKAGDAQARLRAEQAAAGRAIVSAEANLGLARAQANEARQRLGQVRARLDAEQRPAALLLAGLAQLGRRPPILSIADSRSVADIVHLRALVDATLPAIRAQTGALRGQLAASEALASQVAASETQAATRADELIGRQRQFAQLEGQLNARLARLGGTALGSSDIALARAAEATRAADQAGARRLADRAAADLALLPPAPPRPGAASPPPPGPPLPWQLPVAGPILTGLGEISPNGVRSRGLTIASFAGAPVLMPAAGTLLFAGPFRHHLSVIVLDHGGGWMTLLTEVRTTLPRGTRLAAGEPLGRALGPVTVELSRNGQPQAAALIAGSSGLLSNGAHPR